MDENPYKASDEIAATRDRHSLRHPMLDPLWQRATWVILMLPFLLWFVTSIAISISR